MSADVADEIFLLSVYQVAGMYLDFSRIETIVWLKRERDRERERGSGEGYAVYRNSWLDNLKRRGTRDCEGLSFVAFRAFKERPDRFFVQDDQR